MAKKKEESTGEEGCPGWITTYGDLMSLLLTFFILLFAYSSIDIGKFEQAIISLKIAFGVSVMQGANGVMEMQKSFGTGSPPGGNLEWARYEEIAESLEKYFEKAKLKEDAKLEINERGLIIRLTGKVLFDFGKADLRKDAYPILNKVIEVVKKLPNNISVEGHTDNVPIHTKEFPSNWELSVARASRVVRYFIEVGKISPKKLMAAGYGKYRPLYPNDTLQHRALNRRVEIVVLTNK